MIYYVSGDIFATKKIKYYAHGCNCIGGMSKGIAIQFKLKWPKMFVEYKKLCFSKNFVLGDVFLWKENNNYIFNLATQQSWKTPATIDSILLSLNKMVKLASKIKISYVTLPKIGSGLGGLQWHTVKKNIEKNLGTSNVDLIIFENFIKNVPLLPKKESLLNNYFK